LRIRIGEPHWVLREREEFKGEGEIKLVVTI